MPVKQRRPAAAAYFGRIVGSPPGDPGGEITGVLPSFGASLCICGSMFEGGHSTPSDWASRSLSGSRDCPVVCDDVAPIAGPEFGG